MSASGSIQRAFTGIYYLMIGMYVGIITLENRKDIIEI